MLEQVDGMFRPEHSSTVHRRVLGSCMPMRIRPVGFSIKICLGVRITLCPELTSVPRETSDFWRVGKTCAESYSCSNLTGRCRRSSFAVCEACFLSIGEFGSDSMLRDSLPMQCVLMVRKIPFAPDSAMDTSDSSVDTKIVFLTCCTLLHKHIFILVSTSSKVQSL